MPDRSGIAPDLVLGGTEEAAEPVLAELPRTSGTSGASVVPSLDRLEDARAVLEGIVARTPMEVSRYLGGVAGAAVHLKCENLQRTGSFKIRGASYRLSHLTPEERARGVVAASAGNHAQGVALAARELGVHATVFMPVGVPLPKLEATRDYGATIELVGHAVDQSLEAAAEFAERTGAVLIPPFDHPDVIAGQGTLGLELMDEVPDVATVVVPIGGGGLIAGVAAAVKQRAALAGRTVRVVGVQAENAATFPASLAAGEATTVATAPTISDGIAVATPGRLTFSIVRELVDEVVTVTDDETAGAILVLLERAKMVVEPAGAVGVAALLAGKLPDPGTTVIVLSGGNVDPLMMERVISRGLVTADRYLTLRIGLPDRPGQLAEISALIAEVNANVVEVLHTRRGSGLQISEVQIDISVETRGPDHRDRVMAVLREAGYRPHQLPG